MILWSIQHQAAYDRMLQTGMLVADERYQFCEDDLRFAYDWMAEQMVKRIGPPPDGIRYPVWAWFMWSGKRKRLDLRTHRRWTKRGTPLVLLTVDVPDAEVLLSDFDTWHIALNDGYYPDNEGEDYDVVSEKEKRKSWEKIFVSAEDEKRLAEDGRTIQATVWCFLSEWIRKAESFVSG